MQGDFKEMELNKDTKLSNGLLDYVVFVGTRADAVSLYKMKGKD